MLEEESEIRQCGLCYQMTLTKNPHPQAGQLYLDFGTPQERAVGSSWECIPCLLENVRKRAKREYEHLRNIEEMQETINILLSACNHGDFRNGNTDDSGSIDEGNVMVSRIIDRAEEVQKRMRDRYGN